MLDNFTKIGEYRPGEVGPEYQRFIGRTKSKVMPIVYLFAIDGEIVYIGETRRGYSRPLSYHKNEIMVRQREGILEANAKSKTVEIYAIEVPNILIDFNNERLSCYIAQDYEKFLIEKYRPVWNGRR